MRHKLFGGKMGFLTALAAVVSETLEAIVQLKTELATALAEPQASQDQVNAALAERDKAILALQALTDSEATEDENERVAVEAMVNSLREAIAPVATLPVEPTPVEPTL